MTQQSSFAEAEQHRLEELAQRIKRRRLVWILVLWAIAAPFVAALWLYLKWIGIALLVGLIWVTWDYYRKGDMLSVIEASQREGLYLPDYFTGKDG